MQKQRLIYRVLIKVMTLGAVLMLFVVFLNSLFLGSGDHQDKVRDKTVIIRLSGMAPGDMRKARWNAREVAILKYAMHTSPEKMAESQHLNPQTRSILPGFFVFFNTGDSGHCPLFFNGKTLKDTCSGKHFDLTGREKGTSTGGMTIEVPPHYFVITHGKPEQLIVGVWKSAP